MKHTDLDMAELTPRLMLSQNVHFIESETSVVSCKYLAKINIYISLAFIIADIHVFKE